MSGSFAWYALAHICKESHFRTYMYVTLETEVPVMQGRTVGVFGLAALVSLLCPLVPPAAWEGAQASAGSPGLELVAGMPGVFQPAGQGADPVDALRAADQGVDPARVPVQRRPQAYVRPVLNPAMSIPPRGWTGTGTAGWRRGRTSSSPEPSAP